MTSLIFLSFLFFLFFLFPRARMKKSEKGYDGPNKMKERERLRWARLWFFSFFFLRARAEKKHGLALKRKEN